MDALHPPPRFMEETRDFGIEFDAGDLERLGAFLDLLLDANTRLNLTAITDPDDAWHKHIFDSLTLLKYVVATGATRLIDVGTGGGMPGLPLAIVRPEVEVTLLEATGKKTDFLHGAAERLGLANVTVVNDRAETIGHDREHHREHYDLVTARAVGPVAVLAELTLPLAKVGGHVLAVKGRKAAQEIEQARAALHLLHGQVTETARTPTGTIVVIEKRRSTPKLYPRRPGEPKRAPLGGTAKDS